MLLSPMIEEYLVKNPGEILYTRHIVLHKKFPIPTNHIYLTRAIALKDSTKLRNL